MHRMQRSRREAPSESPGGRIRVPLEEDVELATLERCGRTVAARSVAGMNPFDDMTTVIADAGWHHHGVWWLPFGLLWLVLAGIIVWLGLRGLTRRRSSASEI